MNNLNLDKEIIEKVSIIKSNKKMIDTFTQSKKIENLAKKVSRDLKGKIDAETIQGIYENIQFTTKGYNDEIKPYKEANDLLQQSIAHSILEDYESNGVNNHLLLETTRDFPKIATVKVNAERRLEMVENKKILEDIVQDLIDTGRLDLLQINAEAYFEESKKEYGATGKHLKGVFETAPDVKVKITYKK